MKYSSYRKGLKSIRKVLFKDGVSHENQFIEFDFEPRRRVHMTGVWSAKTNNVVAVKNKKGTVFVRPKSVYAGQLLGSTHKVIAKDDMRKYRQYVSSYVRNSALTNMYLGDIVERLVNNKDNPGRVFIFNIDNPGIDMLSLIKEVRPHLLKYNLKNTLHTLADNPTLTTEDRPGGGAKKIYIEIKDYSDEIKREEQEKEAKLAIARNIAENFYPTIEDYAIRNQRQNSYNPLQFTYEYDGEMFTGTVNLQHCRVFRETGAFDIDELVDNIRFRDLLCSLPEQRGNQYATNEYIYSFARRGMVVDPAYFTQTVQHWTVSEIEEYNDLVDFSGTIRAVEDNPF